VWGITGLFWYIFASFLARDTKIEILKHDGHVIRFVVPSYDIAKYIEGRARSTVPPIPTLCDYGTMGQVLPMLAVLIVLVIHAIILFGVLVKKCSDCGGCSDDGPPDEGCYYNGEPGRILGTITLLICVSLIVVRLALRYDTKHKAIF
jgi:hypothetical protein